MIHVRAAIRCTRRLTPAIALLSLVVLAVGCARIQRILAGRAVAPRAEVHYLSGHGPSDARPWEFFCTEGRDSGYWTTIPVPSQWEQQGFGGYNYGQDYPAVRVRERGLYRLRFPASTDWAGRRVLLAFEGVMTDAAVRVNGVSAGPTHQGGFYRFKYDVTDLLKLGEPNLLEVDVSKASADRSVEAAEREGDYWIFGGIYRPVYLEVLPSEFIDWTAIDARADGSVAVDARLAHVSRADRVVGRIVTLAGEPVGAPFQAAIPADKPEQVRLTARVDNPRLWSAEMPNLYRVELTLMHGRTPIHRIAERFGFRTFEMRPGQGFFLNGKRIVFKGICRHSFRPETGRALNPEDCYTDARLIKEMNMNAVRMSHYPPDAAFLDACDELGLYVLDELGGWHAHYDTEVGGKLVREMVIHDVNHPSILLWDNGNEGGWNEELDGAFALYDPQRRLVLHPFATHDGINTMHYPLYHELLKILEGPEIAMPTEILHGLFDGGMGAALEDYWTAIQASPLGGGLFLWVFADEGIVRTDQGGRIDLFDSYAPDGVLGPHHEREGSVDAIREIFCPVQVELKTIPDRFDGAIPLRNEYAFTSLDRCRFRWQWVRFPATEAATTTNTVLAGGELAGPATPPGGKGTLQLEAPAPIRDPESMLLKADALLLTAIDPSGAELWTWSLPVGSKPPRLAMEVMFDSSAMRPAISGDEIHIRSRQAGAIARFDKRTGVLLGLEKGGRSINLSGGPRLVFSRAPKLDEKQAAVPGKVKWFTFAKTSASPGGDPANVARAFDGDSWTCWVAAEPGQWIQGELDRPRLASAVAIDLRRAPPSLWTGYRIDVSPDGKEWTTVFVGERRERGENRYDIPLQWVRAVRLTAGRQSDGSAVTIGGLRVGYEPGRYAEPDNSRAEVAIVNERLELKNAGGLDWARWSMTQRGVLYLEYHYTLPEGEYEYAGITFDYPEKMLKSMKWLGQGPFRAWKNRLAGTTLGVHELAYNDNPPGLSWNFPEFKGYFAGMRWLRLETEEGPLTFATDTPDLFFRVGTQKPNHPEVSPNFPAGELSFLHAIPPIGSKFKASWLIGPQSAWTKGGGVREGRLYLRF
jgi:hypothetical protein